MLEFPTVQNFLRLSEDQVRRIRLYAREKRLVFLKDQETVGASLLLAQVPQEKLADHLPVGEDIETLHSILQALPEDCLSNPSKLQFLLRGRGYFPKEYQEASVTDQILGDFFIDQTRQCFYVFQEHHSLEAYGECYRWLLLCATTIPKYAFVALKELPIDDLFETNEPVSYQLFQTMMTELEKQPELSAPSQILLLLTLLRYFRLVEQPKTLSKLSDDEKTAIKAATLEQVHQQLVLVKAALASDTPEVQTEMRLAFGNAILSEILTDTPTFYEVVFSHPHPGGPERDLAQDRMLLEAFQESLPSASPSQFLR